MCRISYFHYFCILNLVFGDDTHKTGWRLNKQQLELAAIKAGEIISKDETKSLVMSLGHRLTAVIVRKGSATK